MLNEMELLEWCRNLKMSEPGIKLIQRIREANPARLVGNRRGNVCGRYPSQKMGVTIQFESHTVELPGITIMENDEEILEYYDQPERIPLHYKAGKKDKVIGLVHTPDFFVLRTDSVGYEEWKTEEELIGLSIQMPNRYVMKDGVWRCPPGEEYAAQFGFYYKIRSSSEINRIFYRNMIYLDDYFRATTREVEEKVKQVIIETVEKKPGIKVLDLLKLEDVTADDINILIAKNQIYVDLFNDVLAEPDLVYVYKNKSISEAYQIRKTRQIEPKKALGSIKVEAGTRITWDGNAWIIINNGVTEISIAPVSGGEVVPLSWNNFVYLCNEGKIQGVHQEGAEKTAEVISEKLLEASEEDLKIANDRYNLILSQLKREEITETKVSLRTIRNWKRAYKEAEELYGFGYLGLIPNRRKQGNIQCKIIEPSLELMNKYIESYYETKKWPLKIRAYEAYSNECANEGVPAVSEKTFYSYIKKRPQYEQILKTQGPRAAYKLESWYIEWDSPRHGDRPFEICHMDHTELDIQLVDSETGTVLGRPWLSLLIDAYSRRILAAYLTFDAPSYRSCMMLLRECVKRHGRLPQQIVVDNGKEFGSVYFESMLAMYECTKLSRPPAKSRFGSVCERIFGTTNTLFVHNLLGNTKIMRNYRQVTKSVNPQNLAVWTMPEFYPRLLDFVYEVYDQREHSTLSQSPRELFTKAIARTGKRFVVCYDEMFKILSLPGTAREVTVHAGSGVQIKRFTYWSEAFRDPKIQGKKVAVRYDPLDISQAWAYVHSQWVSCRAGHYFALRGRTEKEIEIATKVFRKLRSRRSDQVTEKQLINFLQSTDAEEAILLQRRRDSELKNSLRIIEGGKSGTESAEIAEKNNRYIKATNSKDEKNSCSPTFDWGQI